MKNKFRIQWLIILLFLITVQTLESSTPEPQVISVPLEIKTNVPADYNLTSLYENRDRLKGIPNYLNEENSLVKYYSFGTDTLFMLIGDANEKERICIIDVDMNRDFSDNYNYHYDLRNAELNYPPQSILVTNKSKERKYYFVSPVFKNGAKITYSQKNEIQQRYRLLLGINQYYKGTLYINNKPYVTVIEHDLRSPSGRFMYLLTDSIKFDENRLGGYKFNEDKDAFLIDSLVIKPLSFSVNRTNIDIQITKIADLKKEQLFGFDEGFYALSINKKDIKGKEFKLDKLKGKYVLLDFWGTWCNPCIALLPHISDLHKQYPDLEIVSIASEFNETDKNKIPGFIKKYEMDWVNIFELIRKEGNITSTYNISSFPTTMLIGPKGEIIHRGGSGTIQQLDRKLKDIFNKVIKQNN